MAQLTPTSDFVLVQVEPPPDYSKYKGYTVVVPDLWSHGPEDRPVWGQVVELGDACRGIVKTKERVILPKGRGAYVNFEGTQYMMIREEDILAIYE